MNEIFYPQPPKKFDRDNTFVHYKFPAILHVSDMIEAIKGREEFRMTDRGDHLVFNYAFTTAETFPHVNSGDDRTAMLLRECRGIAFDKATGTIIRRPPHKFFNYKERRETLNPNFDELRYDFLEKMDGSCISVYRIGGKLIWGTPAGETDYSPMVEEFVKDNPQYIELANYLIDLNWTPSFEFCSRKNRVVLDHPVDRLVLHSVRNWYTGEYLPYDQMLNFEQLNIEVVHRHNFKRIESVLDYLENLQDSEGLVLRFENGHMIKLKCEWYCNLHGVTTGIRFEKDVLNLIINDLLDDAKPFLPEDMAKRLEDYSNEVYDGLLESTRYIAGCIHDAIRENLNKKQLAERHEHDPFFMFIARGFDDAVNHRFEKMSDTIETVTFRRLKKEASMTSSQTWIDKRRYLYGNKRFDI
ncbi:putative RNA ligase [Sinorhizobium phage phiM12]|uniref:Putative RNA ligase n=1 Tax=Sinorhizobium phage phiM12 TaxID=1357423 RepID=S5MVP5_9CAUD|nr:RNA ligase and tail fiber protein attachment catalyst [Sinorhizobium phage phiM12]AGR47967.1 putative RNA ligase [Sinorhizobium phage phiM12]AKF13158.1 RNA ligase [Sinorhizobium phage phiM19]